MFYLKKIPIQLHQHTHKEGLTKFGLKYVGKNGDFEGYLTYTPPFEMDAHLYALEHEAHRFQADLKEYYECVRTDNLDAILFIVALKTLLAIPSEHSFLKETISNDFDSLMEYFDKNITHQVINELFLSLIYSTYLIDSKTKLENLSKETIQLKNLIHDVHATFHFDLPIKHLEQKAICDRYLEIEQQHTSNIVTLPFILNRFGYKIIFEKQLVVRSLYVSPRQYIGKAESLNKETTKIEYDKIYYYPYNPIEKSKELPKVFDKFQSLYNTLTIGFSQLLILRKTELYVLDLITEHLKNNMPKSILEPAIKNKEMLFFCKEIVSRGFNFVAETLQHNPKHTIGYTFLVNLHFFSLVTTNLIGLHQFNSEDDEKEYSLSTKSIFEEAHTFMQNLSRINFIPSVIHANQLFNANNAYKNELNTLTETYKKEKEEHHNSKQTILALQKELKEAKNKIQKLENNPEIKHLQQLVATLQTQQEDMQQVHETIVAEFERQAKIAKSDSDIKERNLTQLNTDLKKNVASLTKKLEESNRKQAVITTNPPIEQGLSIDQFETWIEKADFHLQSVNSNERQRQLLHVIERYLDVDALRGNTRLKEKIEFIKRFGYVSLDEQPHVIFANGERMPLINLPKGNFLANHQFVLVGKDGEHLYNFPFFYEAHEQDYKIIEFAVVEDNEDNKRQVSKKQVSVRTLNNELITLKLKKPFSYKKKQIVSYSKVDGEYVVHQVYPKLPTTLDSFYEDIVQRGFTPLVYNGFVSNGMLVYNIPKNEEQFIPFDNAKKLLESYNVAVGQIIIFDMNNNVIIRTFSSHVFRQSSFYNLAESVTVSTINDAIVFIERQNGERIVLKDIPPFYKAKIGDVIRVDEHGSFLQTQAIYQERKQTVAERMKKRSREKTDSPKESLPLVTHKVLILGNPSNEFSYQTQLRKNGFEATVLDGYCPKHKALSAVRNHDFVVVCANHISHDNMWAIRDSKSIKACCLFPQSDGANMIIKTIQESKHFNASMIG